MLTPRSDGRLASAKGVRLPIMAPRLQGELDPSGRLELSLWGSGQLAVLRFGPFDGPFVYAPNRLQAANGEVAVAQSAPVLALRGMRLGGVWPALRIADWDRRALQTPVRREGTRRIVELPWAMLIVEARGEDLVVAAGADHAEAEAALRLSVDQIVGESRDYADHCDRLPAADPMLRSLVSQGVHAALASVRRDGRGDFAGLAAGLAYSAPARTYYRDGYWTCQALLSLAPSAVADEIEVLARAVRDNGQAPSGVIVTGAAQAEAWRRLRAAGTAEATVHQGDLDWWSDHFNSPLFFIRLVADYVEATGDHGPADRHWPLMTAVFERYLALRVDGLPAKPRNDRDWADNVYRSGAVAYDLGLWVGALDGLARMGRGRDPEFVARAEAAASQARTAIEARLWRPSGWYADYAGPDGSEDHLALDSLTLLRHDAVSSDRAGLVLAAVAQHLETRRNGAQPWGDWGMLCAYPPFARRGDLRGKTAFPFRYHNGGDWPWLDGLYARERLRRGLPGWRYPLVRWWETCLANGWAGAVEYFSPPFGRGSLLQGWSSHPSAVALAFAETVLAGDADDRSA